MKQKEIPGSLPLAEPRHEHFAQLVASGKKQLDAYQEAGFSRNRGNAHKLSRRPEVATRLAYLQGLIEREVVSGEIKARTSMSFSKVDAFADLDKAFKLAISKGHAAAAVSAVMGKAKIAGLLVDRHLHAHKRIEDMNLDELLAFFPDLASADGDGSGARDAAPGADQPLALESAQPAGRA